MGRGFLIGLIASATAVSLWGVQLPVAKDAFTVLDPFHMTSIRFAVPALIMLLGLYMMEGRAALSYDGSFRLATVLGVIGMCGSPIFVFIGMSMSRAEHAAVIVALQPTIAAIALWYLRGVRPAYFTIAAIVVAFIGVVLVVTKGHLILLETPRELLGDIIVFIGAAFWVVYTMGTPRLAGWSIWRITVLTMVPGAITTIGLTECLVLTGYIARPTLANIVAVRWELSYLAFGGVLLAMLAWNFGNRRIGPQNATLLINLLPVATFAYRASQGYRFEIVELVGGSLVVAALVANNLYLRSQHPRNPRVIRSRASRNA